MAGCFRSVLALLVLTQCSMAWASVCQLPGFLTERPHWEKHIKLQRQTTGAYIKFEDRLMTIMDFSTPNQVTVERECVRDEGNGKFIFKQSNGEKEWFYICMKFIQRSTHIVQLESSEFVDVLDDSICDETKMKLDEWPMVWPIVDSHDQYESCSLHGGYDFHVFDNEYEETLCHEYFLKPRLESECIAGEGLTIDFRHFDCMGDISMNLIQKLSCLGSWIEGDYEFTILTDMDDMWPKLWMLRVPAVKTNSMHAQLLLDLVADTNPIIRSTPKIYSLHLTTSLYPSLCENEATNCQKCGENNEFYCQKSCQKCDTLTQTHRCQFPRDIRGEWLESTHTADKEITIVGSMLYADGLLPLQCFELHADEWFEGQGRYALATVLKNGCKPRYTCVEMKRRAPDVAQYRLSQSLVWPFTLNLEPEDVCSSARFKDDPSPLEETYRNEQPKVLVKKKHRNDDQRMVVPCRMNRRVWTSISVPHTNDQNGTCRARLSNCDDPTRITMETFGDGCQGFKQREDFRCVASFNDSLTDYFMITEHSSDPDLVRCWLLHQDLWEIEPTLFLTHLSDCNEGTAWKITYHNYTDYIARFDMFENAMYSEHYLTSTCEKPEPELHPATTKRTTSPTESISLGPTTVTKTPDDGHKSHSTTPPKVITPSSNLVTRKLPPDRMDNDTYHIPIDVEPSASMGPPVPVAKSTGGASQICAWTLLLLFGILISYVCS